VRPATAGWLQRRRADAAQRLPRPPARQRSQGRFTMTMNGKVALVTGASRGIGAAVARAYAEAGAGVVLAARDVDALDRVARDIDNAIVVPTDVTDDDAVARL